MKIYLVIQPALLLLLCVVNGNVQAKARWQDVGPMSPVLEKNDGDRQESILQDSDPYFFETDTIVASHGPKSITRNILQDSKGNIWLATWEGIICYDGKKFTNVTKKDDLKRFHFFSILEDDQGNIWFGTIGIGVYRYDGTSFKNFTTKDGLAGNRVGCIYQDKQGNVWLGTEAGASRYDGKSFENFTTKEGLPNNDINSFVQDKQGTLWIGTRGSACRYDMKTKTFSKIKRGGDKAFENVRTIIEDREGSVWLAGNDGLWAYQSKTWHQVATEFVGCIYEDKKGDLWTTSEGPGNSSEWVLSRYPAGVLRIQVPTPRRVFFNKGMLFGIHEDKAGGIWVGSVTGARRYDGSNVNYFKDKLKKAGAIFDK